MPKAKVVRCWERADRAPAGQEVGIGTCRPVFALDALGGCRGRAGVAVACAGGPVEAPGGVGTGERASEDDGAPGRPRGGAGR